MRGLIGGGLASTVAVVGLVAFATPAFAQDNAITPTASCSSPLGSGFQVTWTIANDFNLPETGSVTTVTGGLGTLNATSYTVPASSGQPSQAATLTQTLPAGATGVVTLEASSTWSNGVTQTDTGTVDLSAVNCAAPQKTTESVSVPSGGAGQGPFSNNPSSVTPSPVTPSPVTPSPVTPSPVAPSLIASSSVTSSSPAPSSVTQSSVTPSPATPSSVSPSWSSSPSRPSISLKKSASVSSFSAGTLITYSYKVTNTGNVTLNPVTVSDPMVGLSPISCPVTSLAPWVGETCTATYTATQGDVDHGSLQNTGTATGTPPTGPNVTAQSTVCIPVCQYPSIALEKSASVSSFSSAGTLITYSFKVTNTGNVTLNPVTVSDPMVGLSPISCPADSLAPWVSETCTATYTATQSDVDQGSLCNTGTATGTPPTGPYVTAQSTVCIPAVQSPSMSVVKSADVPTVSTVGQVVTYSFTITNTGNVTLSDVNVTDAQAAPSLDSSLGPISCTTGTNGSITLAPQATDTCSATYTVTQADLTNNSITDTATVTGHPPNKLPPVTGTSTLTLTVTSVSVVKAASPAGGVVAGSSTPIVYTLTVKNTGSATTTAPIVVTDSAPTGTTLVAGSPACVTGGPPTCTVAVNGGTIAWTIPAGVAPGASYTLTYSVTANGSDATGIITNTASWTGPSCSPPVVTPPVTTCATNTVKTPVTAAPVTKPVVSPTTPVTPVSTTTPAPVSPSAVPATTQPIAFTGAPLSLEGLIALTAFLLGTALVVLARRPRRRGIAPPRRGSEPGEGLQGRALHSRALLPRAKPQSG